MTSSDNYKIELECGHDFVITDSKGFIRVGSRINCTKCSSKIVNKTNLDEIEDITELPERLER